MRSLGTNGRNLLKGDEACRLQAYDDATGKPLVSGGPCLGKPTIGWGHTGPEVVAGLVWTQDQADAQFEADIQSRLALLNAEIHVPVSQNEFDALFCLGYNIGFSAEDHSTLMAKVNAMDFPGALAEFPKWNKAGGKVSNGLIKRRADEARLFSTPD